MERLYYFSGSADRPPGQGTNEVVRNPDNYRELRAIPHWRRILSNFWISPFTYRGLRWNTVEHAYQAAKIQLVDPEVAYRFSLDSGSDFSRFDGLAARSRRKIVILNRYYLQEWDRVQSWIIRDLYRAKFSNPEFGRVLLATRPAELWHGAPRIPASRQLDLELVRSEL